MAVLLATFGIGNLLWQPNLEREVFDPVLPPMDGDYAGDHGERWHTDPGADQYPHACFCGRADYWTCVCIRLAEEGE